MRRVMVYYTVKPEAAEANERVVRDVYEEFGRLRPDEFPATARSCWTTAPWNRSARSALPEPHRERRRDEG